MSDTATESKLIPVYRVTDPLSPSQRETIVMGWKSGCTIEDLVPHPTRLLYRFSHEVWAILNGKRIEVDRWPLVKIKQSDELIFTHRVEWLPVALFVVSLGINYYLSRGKKPVLGESPTYNFGQVETTVRNGQPISAIYGRHVVGGQWLNPVQDINQNGDGVLNALISLGEGPLKSIGGQTVEFDSLQTSSLNQLATLVKVNNVTIDNFPEISVSGRLGLQRQSIIAGFQDLQTVHPDGRTLNAWQEITFRTSNKINGINLLLSLPEGLYFDGKILHAKAFPVAVFFRPIYGSDGEGIIHPAIQGFDNPQTLEELQATHIFAPTGSGTYSPWQLIGQISQQVLHLCQSKGLNYHVAMFQIRAKKTSPFIASIKIPDLGSLPLAQYEFTVVRMWVDDPPGSGHHSKTILQSSTERTNGDGITYRKRALMAVAEIANENLNGSLPNLSVIVQGLKVPVWVSGPVTSPWMPRIYTSNPAWIALSILLNNRFGVGRYITLDDIDLQSFKDWADYCDELIDDGMGTGSTMKRWEFNGVFDTQQSAWEQLRQVAAAARAVIVPTGNLIRAKVDEATSPTQLFSVGNVIKDSLIYNLSTTFERYNEIEIQFLNEDRDYNQDIASWQLQTQTDTPKKRSESLFGITKYARALRAAKYLHNKEQQELRSVEFRAPVDSIACEVWDVIALGHDLPAWNILGGRAYSDAPSTTTIKLDRDLTISGGQTPRITVRTSSTGVDVFQTRNITNGAGTYTAGTSLTVSSAWNTSDSPKQGDLYTVSLLTASDSVIGKLFRITEILRSSDQVATIRATEYVSTVYDDDPGTISQPPSTHTPGQFDLPPDVDGIHATAIFGFDDAGRPTVRAIVGWTKTAFGAFYSCRVYLQLSDDPNLLGAFDLVGETTGNSFQLPEGSIQIGKIYTVAVVSVSAGGNQKPPEAAPFAFLSTMPSATPNPPDLTGFAAVQVNPALVCLTWTEIDPATPNFAGYELRRGSGSWNDTILVYKGNDAVFETSNFLPGNTETFQVRAFTSDGVASLNPASVTIFTIVSPWTAGATTTEAPTFAGSKYNCTVHGAELDQDPYGLEIDSATFTFDSALAEHTQLDEMLMAYIFSTFTLSTNNARFIAVEVDVHAGGNDLTIDHAQFTFDSQEGQDTHLDVGDTYYTALPPFSPEINIRLEISRSTDGISFGAYEPFQNGVWNNCFAFKIKLLATRSDANYDYRGFGLTTQVFTM